MSRRVELKRDLDRGRRTPRQSSAAAPSKLDRAARAMLRAIERELGAEGVARVDAQAKGARRGLDQARGGGNG